MVAAATARASGGQPPARAAHRLVPEPPESFWYSVKCRVLGPPLVTGQLSSERLSRPGTRRAVLRRTVLGRVRHRGDSLINPAYELLP